MGLVWLLLMVPNGRKGVTGRGHKVSDSPLCPDIYFNSLFIFGIIKTLDFIPCLNWQSSLCSGALMCHHICTAPSGIQNCSAHRWPAFTVASFMMALEWCNMCLDTVWTIVSEWSSHAHMKHLQWLDCFSCLLWEAALDTPLSKLWVTSVNPADPCPWVSRHFNPWLATQPEEVVAELFLKINTE